MKTLPAVSIALTVLGSGVGADQIWPYTTSVKVRIKTTDYVVTHSMWIPPAVSVVRGLLIFQGHHTDGTNFAASSGLRQLAGKISCGVVAIGGNALNGLKNDTTGTAVRMYMTVLDSLAKCSNHPEIANAPIMVWGHSNGCGYVHAVRDHAPDRVFSWIAFRPGNNGNILHAKANAYGVWGTYFVGGLEQQQVSYINIPALLAEIAKARAKGPRFALYYEPTARHTDIGSACAQMHLDFIEASFRFRVPSNWNPLAGKPVLHDAVEGSGWKGSNTTYQIAQSSGYSGQIASSSWLCDEAFARTWQSAHKGTTLVQRRSSRAVSDSRLDGRAKAAGTGLSGMRNGPVSEASQFDLRGTTRLSSGPAEVRRAAPQVRARGKRQ